ncbi:GNAT family N-acetyltransferase [Gallaecimonas sp. GXIMD4217]|uniref:GNAT family N-acetyltransferase n=1 Tax=Gallaecimonas sp. GXIMD4217 TaxID=3131927 RepID=UPI00311ADDBB
MSALQLASLTLRPHRQADLPFLRRLYASTREAELAPLGWRHEQRQAFCAAQFEAQYHHYRQYYCPDRFDLICHQGQPIGRLFVDVWPGEIRVVDISLLPDFRGQGIGAHLLERLYREACTSGRSLSIHVERNNPARRLYERLGFQLKTQTDELYLLMERPPLAEPG